MDCCHVAARRKAASGRALLEPASALGQGGRCRFCASGLGRSSLEECRELQRRLHGLVRGCQTR
jgi:hypothetical protein